MYYFLRITPANVLYALWLSLRRPVAVWKIDLPQWLAKRFARARPYRVLTRDEWLLAHDRAFDLWKRSAFPLLSARHRRTVCIDGREVDLSRNLWQLLAGDFEALSIFVDVVTASGGGGACVIEPRIASAFSDEELRSMFPSVRIERSFANRALEHLQEWGVAFGHLMRLVIHTGLSFSSGCEPLGVRRIAWLGISPQEVPDRDDRLDFSWAAKCGCVRASDVAYFLPHERTPAQRQYLEAHGIACVEPVDAMAILPRAVRLRVMAASLGAFLRALSAPALTAPLIARLMARAPHWNAIFDVLGTTTYVTTTSYSWPEKPELALAGVRGIRSIIWAYSANSITFSIEAAQFRNVGVLRSIVIASEFWVWNDAYRDWLEKRRIDVPGSRYEIHVFGPLMCGNAALLDIDPPSARERLGLPRGGRCIGVFDMPPLTDTWRDRFGGGPPMVDNDAYIAFWRLIQHILERVPDCFALIKLKRDFTHPYREFPEFLHALLDENGPLARSGRVRRVDVNVDPYLPIAACDVALGIPYTSPVLAARSAGRPGYYLDPLRRARFPANVDYRALTLSSEDEAVAAVTRAFSAPGELVKADAVTPPRAHAPFHRDDATRECPFDARAVRERAA